MPDKTLYTGIMGSISLVVNILVFNADETKD
jgi:hypothetical protein